MSAFQPGYSFSAANTVVLTSVDSTAGNFTSQPTLEDHNLVVTPVAPLPSATIGVAYSTQLFKNVSGGDGQYRYQTGPFDSGSPPFGLVVSSNGFLYGKPTASGKFFFTVCATDTAGRTSEPCDGTWMTVAAAGTTPAQRKKLEAQWSKVRIGVNVQGTDQASVAKAKR